MKFIIVKCFDDGRATISTNDTHIEGENLATKITLDFTSSGHIDRIKGCDLITTDGTYLRYMLGTQALVELELEETSTIAGELKIVPFVTDEELSIKVKFYPTSDVIIRKLEDAGSQYAQERDDFIAALKTFYDSLIAGIDCGSTDELEVPQIRDVPNQECRTRGDFIFELKINYERLQVGIDCGELEEE